MRAFTCDVCDAALYFENSVCLNCQTPQGFRPGQLDLVAIKKTKLRRCANATLAECNWVLEPMEDGELCRSCALTTTRPNDGDTEGLAEYATAEAAKRRLIYELLQLGLPVDNRISFDLLSSTSQAVVTGHADGKVTLDLAESDPAQREQRRLQMAEPYRTVLGHFRHEIGHYYQDMVVGDDRDACRALFGDEREDYQAAMDRHYEQGPPADWAESFVSAYATMHAWEDWAETFAHYLHIRDTLETAAAYGFATAPKRDGIQAIIDAWLPVAIGVNQINRSMGEGDLYPFALAPPVVTKLGYVHDRITITAQAQRRGSSLFKRLSRSA